jgi:transcriptional regulator with XRE-family HTH domain
MAQQQFQEQLRQYRQRLGLTQADVAARLNVKQPTYADIESGTNPPNVATLERVAAALGLELEISLHEKVCV